MATDILVSPIVDLLLGKLGPLAYQQVCLMYGVEKDLEKLQTTLTTIKNGLLDAEEQQLHNRQVGDWLEKLKDVCYDAEDVFDEFQAEALRRQVLAERGSIPTKVCNALSWPKSVAFRFNIGHKIKEIRERLDEIASNQTKFGFTIRVENRINVRRQRETHSFVVASEIIGREKDKEEVIKLLMDSSDDKNVSIIPIVGIAGLGKTALAKLVYNDNMIDEYFDLKLWICVSNDFVEKKIMIDIIKSATDQTHNDMSLDQLQKKLRDVLTGKKYLLVMDDVWNDDVNKWNEFKNLLLGGANGSKVIVTTRSSRVASIMGTLRGAHASDGYRLEGLPYESCLSLFIKCAFKEKEEKKFPNLVKIGGEIVKKCGGVPLAVKTLGSLLYSSNAENLWKDVKDSELWNLEQKEDDILPALKLSYDQLPSYLKQCFVHCSTFPKDFEFVSYMVVQFWMAQGLLQSGKEKEDLEKIGLQYLKELLSRSFFQDFEEMVGDHVFSFKMHDLMHDLALSMAKNECGIVDSHNHFISKKARHLSFVENNMIQDGVPSFMSNLCRLRTICFPFSGMTPTQSFVESCISMFPFLRYLDLSFGSFVLVPKKIGNLRHLRYLNLTQNVKIKKLPNSICKLQSLQTLALDGCEQLQELPGDIRYLISLRFLWLTTNQTCLPHNGIGRLNSLCSLYINSCINLEYLVEDIGNLKTLKALGIVRCPNLVSLPSSIKRLSSLENLELSDCEKLNFDWGMGMGMDEEGTHQDLNGTSSIKRLRLLYLSELPKLVELPQWLRCSANTLQWLIIKECPNLLALPDSLQNLKSLQVLGCPKVSSLPQDMHGLTTLEKIEIGRCPKLLALPDSLQSLKSLRVWDCPKVSSLPQDMHGLTTLEKIEIEGCPNLLALPESLQNLKSLRSFLIQDCPKVSSLPQDMHGLTTLEKIEIGGCPTLSERCQQGSGEDWPQIAHVPNIRLDGHWIIK